MSNGFLIVNVQNSQLTIFLWFYNHAVQVPTYHLGLLLGAAQGEESEVHAAIQAHREKH